MKNFALGWLVEKRLVWIALAFLTVGLLGCTDESSRNQIDHTAEKAQHALDDSAHPTPAKHYNPLVVTDKVWGGDTAMRMHRGMPLPPRYETAHAVTLVSSTPMSLEDIAKFITQQTGIAFHLNGINGSSGGSAVPGVPRSIANSGLPPGGNVNGIPGLNNFSGMQGQANSPGGAATSSSDEMMVAYEGPLSGLLERVAAHFGVNWHYDGSAIAITKFETRVFSIEALPGTLSVAEGTTGGGSSGGGSGGSSGGGSGGGGGSSGGSSSGGSSGNSSITQNTSYKIDYKYWDELGQILNLMLGGTGTMVVSPSIGTVTVSTTPEIMHTVADYITKENLRLSRQIAINVEIYTVELQDGMNFNIAFSAVLKKLTDNLKLSGITGAPSPTTPTSGGGSLSVAILGSNGNSVTDIFTALSTIGDTTKVARFPLITLNNRTASRFIGQDQNYVASSSVTPLTSTTGTTTTPSSSTNTASMTTATVSPGFTVEATPRLLDDGRILLQYSLSIVDLLALNVFNSTCGPNPTLACLSTAINSTTVELPQTADRTFIQQAVLKSGSSLILGGAEEDDVTHNSQGVGDANNYALGGGISTSKARTMIFYVMTPQVLDTPHSEQD